MPRNGTINVGATAPISIGFSTPISSQSAIPTVPGSWRISGRQITFSPNEPFASLSNVTLTVPSSSHGILGEDGGSLAGTVVENFDIPTNPTIRG